jgi:hypothetical protein
MTDVSIATKIGKYIYTGCALDSALLSFLLPLKLITTAKRFTLKYDINDHAAE